MRVMAIDRIQQLATTTVATGMLAVPVGAFNLALGFWLSPRLALFGTVVVVMGAGAMLLVTRAQSAHFTSMTKAAQSSFGVAMGLVDGVAKLRVAHAERRAFARWADPFAAMKEAFVAGQRGFAAVTTLTATATALGTAALFLGAATLPRGSLSPATFIAFNTAFGQALAATFGLAGVATFFVQAKPLYESAKPVLHAEREVAAVKADPGSLTGALEVAHVTFRYAPDAPAVLDDVSFSLEPGQFLAIVGPSGAGKSSLIRILLALESPQLGSVRYDGRELEHLDVRSVRSQIGVVTQNVRLLPGDIFRNIVGTRPLTIEDAWEAAEVAGIADDIRAMPMQMHTFVAEGGGTFAGGQRQRLLIARAVAAKPRLLFFDEATSALDNRTQAQVADAIARLRATRVVIAHRLSTVRHADRILVLRDGRVVQDGTFDELVARPGDFADLAQRQLT
jgi:ATP-binding cassette subfamily C protein